LKRKAEGTGALCKGCRCLVVNELAYKVSYKGPWYEQGVRNFYMEEYTVTIIVQQGLILGEDIYVCFLGCGVCFCKYSLYATLAP
jgi:hypothetical protein